MVKKGKNRTKGHQKKRNVLFFWFVGAICLVFILFIVYNNVSLNNSKKGKSFSVRGGETRTVLDPSMFTGYTRSAYIAAKRYPEIMDQVYCYCYCDQSPFYHKSLLSCFVDDHGAG